MPPKTTVPKKKAPSKKKDPARKPRKVSKTLRGLAKASEIAKSPDVSRKWPYMLRDYFIPKKYIAYAVFSALATFFSNPVTRGMFYKLAAEYMPKSVQKGIAAGQEVHAVLQSKPVAQSEIPTRVAQSAINHAWGLYTSNPMSVERHAAVKETVDAALDIAAKTGAILSRRTFVSCTDTAIKSADKLISSDGVRAVLDMNPFSQAFIDASQPYIPSPGNDMSHEMKRDAMAMFTLQFCKLKAAKGHPAHTNRDTADLSTFSKWLLNGVLPRF
jgi:hypothetical protein